MHKHGLYFKQRGQCMHLHTHGVHIYVCVSLCIQVCARLRAHDILYSHLPHESSSSRSCHLPPIPIGDGSALEFIPHHPAELWPSNSQPLWPQQMNNKTRALQQIWGRKKKEEERARCQILTFSHSHYSTLSCWGRWRQDKYGFTVAT